MVDDEWDDDDLPASRFSLRSVLIPQLAVFHYADPCRLSGLLLRVLRDRQLRHFG